MNKITLRNLKDLDKLRGENIKPESFKDIIERNKVKESLIDTGIDGFKEITNLNNISFGHFILIEKILALESLSQEDRVKMVSPIILRPLKELKLDNEDTKKENIHKESVLDINIGSVYGAFNRFMELRNEYLYKTYNGVIYATVHEDEEGDEDEGTDVSSGTTAREFHSKKFFWNSLISDIANGDIFKFDEAVELMMYVVMPYLAEKRSLAIVERLEAKANRKK